MTTDRAEEYSDLVDRRKDLRIPVQFNLSVDVEDRKTGLFYQTYLMSYSTGGICVSWGLCRDCSGYLPGGIHADCIFSPFDVENPKSRDLTIHVHNPEAEESVEFRGKAVYTFKDLDGEQIGIAFSEEPVRLISLLDSICK